MSEAQFPTDPRAIAWAEMLTARTNVRYYQEKLRRLWWEHAAVSFVGMACAGAAAREHDWPLAAFVLAMFVLWCLTYVSKRSGFGDMLNEHMALQHRFEDTYRVASLDDVTAAALTDMVEDDIAERERVELKELSIDPFPNRRLLLKAQRMACAELGLTLPCDEKAEEAS